MAEASQSKAPEKKTPETKVPGKEKGNLKEGQRVKFSPAHLPALELVGKVVNVHEEGDLVDIEAEVDGKIVEVEGSVYTVPAKSVKQADPADRHRPVGGAG